MFTRKRLKQKTLIVWNFDLLRAFGGFANINFDAKRTQKS